MIHPTSNLVQDVLLTDPDLASCLKPFLVQPPGRREPSYNRNCQPLYRIPQLASLARIKIHTGLVFRLPAEIAAGLQ